MSPAPPVPLPESFVRPASRSAAPRARVLALAVPAFAMLASVAPARRARSSGDAATHPAPAPPARVELPAAAAAPDTAWFDAPLRRAQELLDQGRVAAADSAARQLLAQIERQEGAETPAAARALSILVVAVRRSRDPTDPETLALAQRAVELRRRVFGPDDVAVAVALMDLGNVHFRRGEVDQAMALAEQTLALRERHLPAGDRLIGTTLVNVGAYRFVSGDLRGAQEALERALAILERQAGPEHPSLAGLLENLSAVYQALGEPETAIARGERAVSIVEKAFGPRHPQYAESVVSLAALYSEFGDLERALELNERGLSILEAAADVEKSLLIVVRSGRAQLLRRMGRYTEARSAMDALLPFAIETLGPDHPDLAPIHQEAGTLFVSIGDLKQAEVHLQRALAITAKVEGDRSPRYAYQEVSHSAALVKMHRLREAESALVQAVAILDSAGASNRVFSLVLNNLADAQVRLGKPAEAIGVARRAEQMARSSSPREGSHVAMTLSTQGLALLDLGDAPAARAVHEQALAIRQRELGERHPEATFSMFQLALALADLQRSEEALDLTLRCEQVGRDHVRLTARALSEREALLYAAERPRGTGLALALLSRGVIPIAAAARVWNEVARSRGLVLDEMAQRNHAVHSTGDPRVAALEAEVAARRREFAHLMVRDADGGGLTSRIAGAQASLEQAERALADASAEFRGRLEQDTASLPQWLDQLPAQTGLVAYVRFDDPLAALARRRIDAGMSAAGAPRDDTTAPRARYGSEGRATYLAFVQAAAGRPAQAVSLGDAEEVEALVARWREQMVGPPMGPGGNAAAGAAGTTRERTAELEAPAMAAGQALRARVWDPVRGLLDEPSMVLIVPDGQLQLVDFAALPDADGTYLVERAPTLHLLSAERDLQQPPATTADRAGGLLALGDPDFDTAPRAPQRDAGSHERTPDVAPLTSAGAAQAAFRGQRPGCGEFHTIHWKRLPQTKRELEDIEALWRRRAGRTRGEPAPTALLLTGRQAGEVAFKTWAPDHRVVHVATHGFALDGGCVAPDSTTRGIGGYVAGSPQAPDAGAGSTAVAPLPTPATGRPARSENPLQLCGLVLAGANRRDATDVGEEDGILTAEEIAALDLSGVEWAVLSACETGVGAARAGEGVFGMRRAFRVAGARAVIASLWPVQDAATREWMRALYEARWGRGLATAEAVRAAARARLAACRTRGTSTHPRNWAGFIAAGDWR